MGQKVNPLVFRIGSKNKLWNSQYLGNNTEESSYYFFQDLEIRKYIHRLFESYGLVSHRCIFKRSADKLNIFIDFYVTSKVSIKYFHFFSNISIFRSRLIKKHSRPKKFSNLLYIKNKFKKRISQNKTIIKRNSIFNGSTLNYSKFKTKIFETLLTFSKVFKISIHFNNIQNKTIFILNKDLNLKPIVQELNIYSRERFFNEMIEILVIVFNTKGTAKLLSRFIAFQFQVTKRHNTFLIFLKRAVRVFNSIKKFKANGIKIIISGKFNGAPRSKKRTIQSGRLPLQKFNSKINYYHTDAHTPYGTFGIKVWICESN